MSDSVLLQDLQVVSRDLWKLKSHLRAAWRHTQVDSVGRADVEEFQKVLAALHDEVFKLIARERGDAPNSRNISQAQEFAFRSKVAKAYQEASKVFEKGEDDQSHK